MVPPSWAVTELESTSPKAPKPPRRTSLSGRPGRPGRPSLPRRTPRATFRPAPAWSPPRSGRQGKRIAFIALVPLVLALGALGYVLGRGDDEPAATPAATPLVQQASASGVSLRYPAGWVQRSDDPKIEGLSFTRPLAVSSSRASDAVIVAGVVRTAVGSDLLPASLRRRLPGSTPPGRAGPARRRRAGAALRRVTRRGRRKRADAVRRADDRRLGDRRLPRARRRRRVRRRLRALRRDAAPRGPDQRTRLDGRRALPLGPSPAYGKRVAAAISAIEVAQTIEGDRLRKASDAAAQATIADAIATTFARAAGDLDSGPVSARDREGHAGLVRGDARAPRRATAALSSAARDGRSADYATAAAAVTDADARLRRAIGALQTLGYT